MRRLLSIALLLLLALPLVAPALAQTTQGGLLLCCRKGAAHHCMATSAADGPAFSAHCPAGDHASVKAQGRFCRAERQVAVGPYESVNVLRVRQVEAGYRISFYRSRQKRGPPAAFAS